MAEALRDACGGSELTVSSRASVVRQTPREQSPSSAEMRALSTTLGAARPRRSGSLLWVGGTMLVAAGGAIAALVMTPERNAETTAPTPAATQHAAQEVETESEPEPEPEPELELEPSASTSASAAVTTEPVAAEPPVYKRRPKPLPKPAAKPKNDFVPTRR